jgi:hypothetical protein
VKLAFLAGLGLVAACTPAGMASSVITARAAGGGAVVQVADDLSPGDVVHIWHRFCVYRDGICRYRQIGAGVVTGIAPGEPAYAFVDLPTGMRVAIGDRAVKDSPMSHWHRDPPSD